MTTMAAMLGALPLALGTGTGSELRRPLGITIIGGLLIVARRSPSSPLPSSTSTSIACATGGSASAASNTAARNQWAPKARWESKDKLSCTVTPEPFRSPPCSR